jgi:hypothetical protein
VRREQPYGTDVQRAVGEQIEDSRKAAAQPSRLDPVVRGVLGQAQRARAVREERAVALAQVELARVELGEVCDQLDGRAPLSRGEQRHAKEKVGIGESTSGGEHGMVHVLASSFHAARQVGRERSHHRRRECRRRSARVEIAEDSRAASVADQLVSRSARGNQCGG